LFFALKGRRVGNWEGDYDTAEAAFEALRRELSE
jgi:hypothetical protein